MNKPQVHNPVPLEGNPHGQGVILRDILTESRSMTAMKSRRRLH